jgi:hypothetical protein
MRPHVLKAPRHRLVRAEERAHLLVGGHDVADVVSVDRLGERGAQEPEHHLPRVLELLARVEQAGLGLLHDLHVGLDRLRAGARLAGDVANVAQLVVAEVAEAGDEQGDDAPDDALRTGIVRVPSAADHLVGPLLGWSNTVWARAGVDDPVLDVRLR